MLRLPMFDYSLWREKIALIEGQVCRVEVGGNAAGTGFLVGPDAILTCYHVLKPAFESPTIAAAVTFRFDYKILVNGTQSPT